MVYCRNEREHGITRGIMIKRILFVLLLGFVSTLCLSQEYMATKYTMESNLTSFIIIEKDTVYVYPISIKLPIIERIDNTIYCKSPGTSEPSRVFIGPYEIKMELYFKFGDWVYKTSIVYTRSTNDD